MCVPTLDPQNLPAPVATIGPVAQGATAEWVDSEELAAGDYEYAVRDYDGSGEGVLSAVVMHNIPDPFAAATPGDYIGGGVYAGTHTDGASTWHVIFALASAESDPGVVDQRWKTSRSSTAGTTSMDDGLANTNAMIADDIDVHPAAKMCIDYVDAGGNNDYYLPARNEALLAQPLADADHPEFTANKSTIRFSSTEYSSEFAFVWRPSDGFTSPQYKNMTSYRARPVRRVPA